MRWVTHGWRWLRSLAQRRALERGLDEEMRFHIDRQIEKHRRAGMTPDEARRQALVKFGGVAATKERTRDQLRPPLLADVARDVRYGVRALRRAPGFTIAAALTLALGTGATTSVFTVVNAILIKPLPYPNADRLVALDHVAPGINLGDSPEMPGSLFLTYRAEARSFAHIGLWSGGRVSVTGTGEPEELESVNVTDGTLQALGVEPAIGRWFSKEETTPGSPDAILISYGYWQQRHGGDPSIVGRALTVSARPRTVVGVMPKGFRFLDADPAIILPTRLDPKDLHLGGFNFRGIARLKPGVTLEQANADLTRLVSVWLHAWPAPSGLSREFFESARLAPALHPLKQSIVGDVGQVLWVLMGTIGIVLLIACANVANLLLVRAEGRQQELAIRAALGAGWQRIARELLIESLVLALFGGALGLAITVAAMELLVALGPATLPRLSTIAVDPAVLAFTVIVSVLSGLLFAGIPVIRLAGPRVALALRSGGRTASDSKERHRARNALVVVQVALAVILLVASGLMIRSFFALRAVHPGFTNAERIQLVRTTIPPALVTDLKHVLRVQRDMRDRIAAIPGVSAVSFTDAAPMDPNSSNDAVFYEGQPADARIAPIRRYKFIAPGLFDTVGTPIVAGRDLTWDDLDQNRPVAVISEKLARELWREPAAAIGKRIHENPTTPWREIVGVVSDVHDDGVQQPAPAIVYWPVRMEKFWGSAVDVRRSTTFVVRSSRTGTESFIREIARAVWAVNGNVPIAQVRTLRDLYARSLARTSFTLVMLAIAGGMALLLGIIGIYGVIAYAVTQRTREIGIRVALGAQHGELMRMFMRQGVLLSLVGIACGLGAAVWLTRILSSLLFGIDALDPTTYVGAAALLVAAAALASYVPALRTSSVDPVHALRAE